MLSNFSIDFAIDGCVYFACDLLADEEEGDGFFLVGIYNSFLMSPGLSLLAVVELTNNVDSFTFFDGR